MSTVSAEMKSHQDARARIETERKKQEQQWQAIKAVNNLHSP
jgi:hypothetical protein